jgi:hypothetical protein
MMARIVHRAEVGIFREYWHCMEKVIPMRGEEKQPANTVVKPSCKCQKVVFSGQHANTARDITAITLICILLRKKVTEGVPCTFPWMANIALVEQIAPFVGEGLAH